MAPHPASHPAAPSRCLAIVAHPDDCEFGCGGTIAHCTAAGAVASICVLTDGSRGCHDIAVAPADVADQREFEQRASAKILGIRGVTFLRYPDGELCPGAEIVDKVAALIRRIRPEIVFAHDPWKRYQLHPDHRAAGWVACDAVFRAGEPHFRLGTASGLPAWKVGELWLFGAEDPDHAVDISDSLESKIAALLEHRSQYASAFGISDDAEGRTRFGVQMRRRAHSEHSAGPVERFRRLRPL